MIRALLALVLAIVAVPATAQTITLTAPLPDSNRDGIVRVEKLAAELGVPRGTVLKQCGKTYSYVYGKAGCPIAAEVADPWTPRIPVVLARGTSHHLTSPAGPLTFRGEAFEGRVFVSNRGTSAPAHDLTVEGVRAICSETCILLNRPSLRTIIRDVEIIGVGDKAYSAGIKLDGQASDVLIERVRVSNWFTASPAGYPNADCIGTERGNYRITLRFVVAIGCTDGGFDLKSSVTVLYDVKAIRVRYGLRGWAQVDATDLYVEDATSAAIEMSHATTDITVGTLTAVGAMPLVRIGAKGGRLVVAACDLSRWTGTVLVKGTGATVTLGPSCRR